LFSGRKRAFEQMGDAYYFSVHSIRKKKALNEVSNIKEPTIRIIRGIMFISPSFTRMVQAV
jgi:hypothetical protein